MQKTLRTGAYTFGALQELEIDGETIELWQAQDAVVLKAMAMVLGEHLRPVLSPHCYHLAGRGGTRAAMRAVRKAIGSEGYVMKSDVKAYYASMDHTVLFGLLQNHIDDRYVLRLLWGYLKREVYWGGNYREVKRGISLRCPLSPLMGALYLKPLDDAVSEAGFFFTRYMDDWVIVVPTRWKLRKAVWLVNQVLNNLNIEKHPDKTFIGRACRGFDFLGFTHGPGKIEVSRVSIRKCFERIARLYEQGADRIRIGQYVRHWMQWTFAVLWMIDVAPQQTPTALGLCTSVRSW